MASLNLRQKQSNAVVRMLHLNQNQNPNPTTDGLSPEEESAYKILVLDRFCLELLSPLIHVNDIRKHGVTLHHRIEKPHRQRVPDVPVVYFVQPTPDNIARIADDASRGIYDSIHLNFSSSVPRPLLEDLASSTLRSDSVQRISRVTDQYLEFVTLEDDLFTLAHPDAYVSINDPSAGDREIEAIVERVASGLFCALATLGVVPVIRCARGGPSEMVAAALDSRLRDHLLTRNNLFSGLGSSFQRPLLCLFDRNFELAVAVQHDWSYRALVHDVLEMRLNKIQKKSTVQSYELGASDSFWASNGWLPFPKVAEEIEAQLARYKQDVDEVNRSTGGTAGAEFDGTDLIGNTKHLVNAVNSLPELRERKNLIDKHTNIATVLLGEIKERSLDTYCTLEDDMLTKGSVDRNALLSLLTGKGSNTDKLRLAITYLLSSESTSQSELEPIETQLRETEEVDLSAYLYVKKIKSLNASLSSSSAASASRSNIVDWAEKLYGQSISAVTAGMKNLLSGGRQLALTRTVEALMEAKPNPEVDSYVTFDPRAPRSGPTTLLKGPFKEAIVFMIGGGNYIEYRSLLELAQRSQPSKHVIYGTTEILTGAEFVEQLKVLGQKMGVGGSSANPSQ